MELESGLDIEGGAKALVLLITLEDNVVDKDGLIVLELPV